MTQPQTSELHSCLYVGRVRHRRFTLVANAFTYSGFWLYLDLDELDRVFANRWLWSTSRWAVARFCRTDHLSFPEDVLPEALHSPLTGDDLPGPQRSLGKRPVRNGQSLPPLRQSVCELVRAATGAVPAGPIRLLTQLRYFGYVMNPVSLYYCFDATGSEVQTVVAEVNNTPWGERHCYVLHAALVEESPPTQPQRDESLIEENSELPRLRFRHAKRFHVSPFMNLDMDYHWRIVSPGAALTVHIENYRDTECLFDCTLRLHRRPITGRNLATVLLKHPFMTAKFAAGIYWQAAKLWCKRCPFVPHPNR